MAYSNNFQGVISIIRKLYNRCSKYDLHSMVSKEWNERISVVIGIYVMPNRVDKMIIEISVLLYGINDHNCRPISLDELYSNEVSSIRKSNRYYIIGHMRSTIRIPGDRNDLNSKNINYVITRNPFIYLALSGCNMISSNVYVYLNGKMSNMLNVNVLKITYEGERYLTYGVHRPIIIPLYEILRVYNSYDSNDGMLHAHTSNEEDDKNDRYISQCYDNLINMLNIVIEMSMTFAKYYDISDMCPIVKIVYMNEKSDGNVNDIVYRVSLYIEDGIPVYKLIGC